MSFKKLRYNLLVIGLVALICCYIGMSFLFTDSSMNINQGNTEGNIDEGLVDGDDLDEDGNNEEPPEGVEIPSDAIGLIQYGLDIIENGNGYESTFNTTIVNEAVGVSAVQYVDGKVKKGVNSLGQSVSIEENYYHSNESGVAGNMVANFFKGFYVNNETGMTQVATTSDYDPSAQTYNLANADLNKTVPTSDALDEYKILQGLGYPINVTKSNCIITRDNTQNKNVRIITIKITNFASLSQEFLDFLTCTGGMKNIDYASIEISFTINKNNGYITKIQRTENFTATAINIPVLGSVSVNVQATTIQSFKNMNQNIVLSDSL